MSSLLVIQRRMCSFTAVRLISTLTTAHHHHHHQPLPIWIYCNNTCARSVCKSRSERAATKKQLKEIPGISTAISSEHHKRDPEKWLYKKFFFKINQMWKSFASNLDQTCSKEKSAIVASESSSTRIQLATRLKELKEQVTIRAMELRKKYNLSPISKKVDGALGRATDILNAIKENIRKPLNRMMCEAKTKAKTMQHTETCQKLTRPLREFKVQSKQAETERRQYTEKIHKMSKKK